MKFKHLILIFFILTILPFTVAANETRTLKVEVAPVPGETDLTDNSREIEVPVADQEVTDLAVTDISVSPLTISTGTTVDIWVGIKNKGSHPAYNAQVNLYTLGEKDAGDYGHVLVGSTTVSQISASEEIRKEFEFFMPMPEDGYNLRIVSGVKNSRGETQI